jgi:hypothetical protein
MEVRERPRRWSMQPLPGAFGGEAGFNHGLDRGQPLDGARWLGFRDTKLDSVLRAGGSVAPASARAKIIKCSC